MIQKLSSFLAVMGLVLVASCASLPSAQRAEAPPLILVSIDGFRADYLDRGLTPNLKQLADEGATGPMRPSFPSLTFPNHYTIVTGQRPDRHGIVHNTMVDPARPGVVFRLADREQVDDGFWWSDAEPFWETAERVGVRTGINWPGGSAPIHDLRPSLWHPYAKEKTGDNRVDDVLAWLDLPAEQRPKAMTLYFDTVDTAGHEFGPDSAEVNASIADVDASMGRLLEGLKARGLEGKVNLIIIADHGMTKHDPAKFIKLGDIVSTDLATLMGGQVAGITPKAGKTAEVEALVLKPHDHMQCWRKSEIPARFHYGRHRRVPPIVCLAEPGGYIVTPSRDNWMPRPAGGSHGYDPEAAEMRALFIAHGLNIKPGTTVKPFDNVAVYSLIMKLMGLKPKAHDGTPATLAGIIRRQ